MAAPRLEVYCTISNCQWWSEDNHCHASVILITHDRIGQDYPEEVDAPATSRVVRERGVTPAGDCMETCCKTFTPKRG